MNEASQQSNNLDELIKQLKALWQIQDNGQDSQAQAMIKAYTNSRLSATFSSDNISPEEFDIQKRVLAKTREKAEALLKQLEVLEAQQLR